MVCFDSVLEPIATGRRNSNVLMMASGGTVKGSLTYTTAADVRIP